MLIVWGSMEHLSKAELIARIEALERENALLHQKVDLLVRRLFGKCSEALSPDQLELLLGGQPESQSGKADASWALEPQEAANHEPCGRQEKRRNARERWPEDLPVVEQVLERRRSRGRSGCMAADRRGSQRATRLRTRTVPASSPRATQVCAAGRGGCRARHRRAAGELAGTLRGRTRTHRRDHCREVLRSPSALPSGSHLQEPARHHSPSPKPGSLDRACRRLAAAGLRCYRRGDPRQRIRSD